MPTIAHAAFIDLESEFSKTRTMLERVPSDKLDFSPHEKSWELFKLAQHIANLPTWIGVILKTDGLDVAAPFPPRPEINSVEELLAVFDANCKQAISDLSRASQADLDALWTLHHGNHVISKQSKMADIRGWALNHIIHHRAQLSIYFRLVGVPLPGLYGPSADES